MTVNNVFANIGFTGNGFLQKPIWQRTPVSVALITSPGNS